MRVFVVTPPAPVVTGEEAMDQVHVDDVGEKAWLEALVAAATHHIDGPDGWLGRALGEQVLEARFDAFDEHPWGDRLPLPCPPVQVVSSVKYIDAAGAEITWAGSGYRLVDGDVMRIYDGSWPVTRSEREAVRVRYTAGYDTLPPPIRAAILLMVGDLYANRETAVTGTIAASVPMSTTVENLLAPFRVWG